ncbi:hypothetical protein [Caballeronia sp. M1242]|uniref:hypothetical protein n=1 Tax=Caballeronia sp. M1242 TaxID=2814653 RepID=UPI00158D1ACA|nr:hypothetical protein [Caballeronia sp. M1242]QSN62385.1 hypothetical protein JYK05_05780 [Caballeronia sp. M1242]
MIVQLGRNSSAALVRTILNMIPSALMSLARHLRPTSGATRPFCSPIREATPAAVRRHSLCCQRLVVKGHFTDHGNERAKGRTRFHYGRQELWLRHCEDGARQRLSGQREGS